MTVGFTPKWKTPSGNSIIFPAPNMLFETHAEANEWRIGQLLFMIPFGLQPDGVFEFEHDDGKAQIPHVEISIPKLGNGVVIEGPLLDNAIKNEGFVE